MINKDKTSQKNTYIKSNIENIEKKRKIIIIKKTKKLKIE